jgi:hypothetical protein
MNQMLLALLGLVSGQVDSLDTFQFVGDAEARTAWVAKDGTPEVHVADGQAGKALRIDGPFASNRELTRMVIDRDVKLNLSASAAFSLDVNLADPHSFDRVTLYFRSPGG